MLLLSLDFLLVFVGGLEVVGDVFWRFFALDHFELGPCAAFFGQVHADRVYALVFLDVQLVLEYFAQLKVDSLDKLYHPGVFSIIRIFGHVEYKVFEEHLDDVFL